MPGHRDLLLWSRRSEFDRTWKFRNRIVIQDIGESMFKQSVREKLFIGLIGCVLSSVVLLRSVEASTPFPQLLVLAAEGDARSQALVARTYRLGSGSVLRNPAKCLDWAARSSAQGDVIGGFELGISYWEGVGVAADQPRAQKIFAEKIAGIHRLASANDPVAASLLGQSLRLGWGQAKDPASAIQWVRKAAESGEPRAQLVLGQMIQAGEGTVKDQEVAVGWFHRAAVQHLAEAEFANCYHEGIGVEQDDRTAVRWFKRAAYQGHAAARFEVGKAFRDGKGVGSSRLLAYMWLDLAARLGHVEAAAARDGIVGTMSVSDQITGHKWAKRFVRKKILLDASATGTGFFVTGDGFLVTNHHVIEGATGIRARVANRELVATLVFKNESLDLAVLKVEGKFRALPLRKSSTVRVGSRVMTMGFPRPNRQGLQPKFTSGEISSLSGFKDDATRFQVSVPIQPGNSGGPLVDSAGNVVGVISASFPEETPWLQRQESLPQLANYAIKGSFLISELQKRSMIRKNLKPVLPLKARPVAAVVRDLEAATVLLLIDLDDAKVAKSVPTGEYWVGRYALRGKQVVEVRRDGDLIEAIKVTGDWQFGGRGAISWRGNTRTRVIEGQMRQNLFSPLRWVPGRIDKLESDRIEISGRVGIFRRRIKYKRPKPGEVEELIRKDR